MSSVAGLSAYTGLSGSGKSYSVVERVILPSLKSGLPVWTNIPLKLEELAKDYDIDLITEFKWQDLKENRYWLMDVLPKGVVFVFDEVQKVFPAGMKASALSDSEKQFFTEYRHQVSEIGHSTQVVLITQDLSNVTNFIRSLIGVTYRHVKLQSVGLKKFNVGIYEGAACGPNPPRSQRNTKTGPHSYKKEIYKYYSSATASDTGNVGDESRSDGRASIWMNSGIWTGILFVILTGSLGYYFLSKVKDKYSAPTVSDNPASLPIVSDSPPVLAIKAQQPSSRTPEPFDGFDMYIAFNMGNFPRIDYKVKVKSSDSYALVDLQQLRRIGYEVIPLDNCLLLITWQGGSDRAVMCSLPEAEVVRSSFISSNL